MFDQEYQLCTLIYKILKYSYYILHIFFITLGTIDELLKIFTYLFYMFLYKITQVSKPCPLPPLWQLSVGTKFHIFPLFLPVSLQLLIARNMLCCTEEFLIFQCTFDSLMQF